MDRDTAFHAPQAVFYAESRGYEESGWGQAEDMERNQIMKALVWQAKEFTFYPETTGLCWKELECGRDMAIFVVGKGQCGHAGQAFWGVDS